jgi:hypothetical protein
MNLSQTHECGNCETEHYNSVLEITFSFLGIRKWKPDIYIGFSLALYLQWRPGVHIVYSILYILLMVSTFDSAEIFDF